MEVQKKLLIVFILKLCTFPLLPGNPSLLALNDILVLQQCQLPIAVFLLFCGPNSFLVGQELLKSVLDLHKGLA